MKKHYFNITFFALITVTMLLLIGCTAKVRINADVIVPDKLRGTVKVSTIGFTVLEQEILGIGDTIYTQNETTGEWEISDDYPDLSTMATLDFVTKIVNTLTEPTVLDDKEINGTMCYYVSGSVDSSILSDLGFEDMSIDYEGFTDFVLNFEELEIDTELWINKENLLVRRVSIEGWENNDRSDSEPTFLVYIEFSAFNKPVTINEAEILQQ
jgi:hypothetical protein